jgi:uncharacterized protein (TIGR03437 family)
MRAAWIGLLPVVFLIPNHLWGQAVPNFDVRSHAAANGSAARAKVLIESRLLNLASFAENARRTAPGTRIAASPYGLPKLMLRDGGTLTTPSPLDAEEIGRQFLRGHSAIIPLTVTDVGNLRLAVKDVTPDATFLAFNQTVNGIDVFNAQIKFTLSKAGEVVQASAGEVMPDLNLSTTPRLSEQEALAAAYHAVGAGVPVGVARPEPSGKRRSGRRFSYTPIFSELVIFPLDAASARLAYRIILDGDSTSSYEVVIDAVNGDLLFRYNLFIKAAQARVWKISPLVGNRELVTLPGGWLATDAQVTTGNNVDAYIDRNGDDKPDNVTNSEMLNGHAFSASQFFDFAFGDGTVLMDPRKFQSASVTNIFYLMNVAHDYYYGLGFTEAAGNFQADNFGRGGKGNDPVLGEAQQGNTDDNSAFVPTPDGVSPRLLAGLFTMGTASYTDDRDSAYDAQLIMHEYGHGVSNRLVGARVSTSCLANIQSGAMGEGWSDYFGMSYTNNPVFGAYLTGDTIKGIRRQSYDTYSLNYEDIGTGPNSYEVHDDGEVWAATLWDLRKALGQTVTDKLVVNGLKATPCSPSMTQARDAILSADQATNSGANRAKIWQIFAKHGMGYSAMGVDGGYFNGTRYDSAYDQPPDLQTLKNPAITSDPLAVATALGDSYSYVVKASNPNRGTLNFVLNDGPSGMSIGAASGVMNWSATFTGHRVKVTVTDGAGGKVVHGYMLPVQTPILANSQITLSGDTNSFGIATVVIPSNVPVLQVTLRGGSGDADVLLFDPTGSLVAFSAREFSNETVTIASPKAGRWYIEVAGFATYSGVNLLAALVTPALKSGNSTTAGLEGLAGSETLYRFSIPTGATNFTVSTSGGSGDVDLFLRKALPAVCQLSFFAYEPCQYEYESVNSGNVEAISVTNPDAGDWYLSLSGFADYHGVTLVTTLSAPAKLTVSTPTMVFNTPQGGAASAAQELVVSNPGGPTFNWTAQVNADAAGWLQLNQLNGTGDMVLTVSANPAGLRAGSYKGTITFTSTGLAGSPAQVQVTLNVAALSAGATSLTFQAAGASPAPQTLAISLLGGDALNWSATVATASGGNWLRMNPTSGTGSASAQVSVSVGSLAGGNYSGTITITAPGAANSPMKITVSLSVTATPTGPSISGVLNAAGYQTMIAAGEWISIEGVQLSTTTRMWDSPDFQGNLLPLSLDGVSVKVNGRDAAVYFVSPTQINVLAPADDTVGPVTVTVKNDLGTVSASAFLQTYSPAFFTLDGKYVAAAHLDRMYVGPPGLLGNAVATRPAVPGERIVVFGTGFGPTNPAVPTDVIYGGAAPLADLTQLLVRIGSAVATVEFAGVVSNGLYQFNVIVPDLAPGDYPVTANIGGIPTPTTATITISQ